MYFSTLPVCRGKALHVLDVALYPRPEDWPSCDEAVLQYLAELPHAPHGPAFE